MRCKIISACDVCSLEKQINDFIRNTEEAEVSISSYTYESFHVIHERYIACILYR